MQHFPMKEGRSPQDHRMVERFLTVTVWRDMSPEEAGELVDTTGEGVRKWMQNEWVRLNGVSRKALRRFLESRPTDATPDWDAGYLAAVKRIEDAVKQAREAVTSRGASIDEIRADDAVLTQEGKEGETRRTRGE